MEAEKATTQMDRDTINAMFERGDVFENDFQRVEVLRVNRDGRVVVENMIGEEERFNPRELIELTQKDA